MDSHTGGPAIVSSLPIHLLGLGTRLTLNVGGRQRTNCCKVRKPPPPPLYCDVTTCDILSLDESGCSEDRDEYGNRRRDIDLEDGSPVHELEARTGKRPFSFFTSPLGLKVTTESLRYISRTQYMRYLRQNLPGILNRVFRMRSRDCGHPNLGANVLQPNSGDNAPENSQIEHILPVRTSSQLPP